MRWPTSAIVLIALAAAAALAGTAAADLGDEQDDDRRDAERQNHGRDRGSDEADTGRGPDAGRGPPDRQDEATGVEDTPARGRGRSDEHQQADPAPPPQEPPAESPPAQPAPEPPPDTTPGETTPPDGEGTPDAPTESGPPSAEEPVAGGLLDAEPPALPEPPLARLGNTTPAAPPSTPTEPVDAAGAPEGGTPASPKPVVRAEPSRDEPAAAGPPDPTQHASLDRPVVDERGLPWSLAGPGGGLEQSELLMPASSAPRAGSFSPAATAAVAAALGALTLAVGPARRVWLWGSPSPTPARPAGPSQVAATGVPALLTLGQDAINRGELEQALRWFDTALTVDPQLAVGHFCRGLCLDEMGHMQDAGDAFRRACRHDAADVMARYHLASACARLGRPGEALDALEAVLRQLPEAAEHAAGDAAFAALRDHPRFLQLIGRL